jgi:chromosome segregation ATPase
MMKFVIQKVEVKVIKNKIPLLILSVVGLLMAQSPEEDRLLKQIESLKSDIAKANVKISETDSMTVLEQKRFETLKQRSEEDVASKKVDIQSLEKKMNELVGEVRKAQYRQNNADAKVEVIKTRPAELSKVLIEQCENLKLQVLSGIPWDQKKRLDRLQSLKSDIESKSASVEEGLARLKALISEEKRFGDEVAYQERPYNKNDGTLINAKILRVGNLFMVYVDDQEKNYGILQKTEGGYKMFEDLSFEQRQQVRDAIKVKTAKEAPRLVDLPITLSVFSKGAK